MKRSWIVSLAMVALLAGLAGFYWSRTVHTPAGQPPLGKIAESTLSGLQADFNCASNGVRVVLLLSPT